jgi:hypothetical protein
MRNLTFQKDGKTFETDDVFLHHRKLPSEQHKTGAQTKLVHCSEFFLPSDEVLKQIKELKPGEAFLYEPGWWSNINMDNFFESNLQNDRHPRRNGFLLKSQPIFFLIMKSD